MRAPGRASAQPELSAEQTLGVAPGCGGHAALEPTVDGDRLHREIDHRRLARPRGAQLRGEREERREGAGTCPIGARELWRAYTTRCRGSPLGGRPTRRIEPSERR